MDKEPPQAMKKMMKMMMVIVTTMMADADHDCDRYEVAYVHEAVTSAYQRPPVEHPSEC